MSQTENIINTFIRVGQRIKEHCEQYPNGQLKDIVATAKAKNPWFTAHNQINALNAIAYMLQPDSLQQWISCYSISEHLPKNIGVVMAGNIPAVGFHDLMTVLVSGNKIQIKPSSSDSILMEWIAGIIKSENAELGNRISFVDKLQKPDAVIATGSDNTARYFHYYFSKVPHVIRKNRNSVAVLNGNETKEQLFALGEDIFSYFGLGCRNVSKLMVPENYNFEKFFDAIEPYGNELLLHNKYINNYDYYRAIYLMENIPFLTNNFVHLLEQQNIASPVSVLHYETYNNQSSLHQLLTAEADKIQCIISADVITGKEINFGMGQQPSASDYADGVDTLRFLIEQCSEQQNSNT